MKTKTRSTTKKYGRVSLAIVAARFNEDICQGLIDGANRLLSEKKLKADLYRVPGAFEIPLVAKKLALSKKYDGILCLGAVIRGDTAHFDYVCKAVTDGVLSVSLSTLVPCGFGVLTVDHLKQAQVRSAEDDFNKGRECALAVLETVEVCRQMRK